MQTALAALALLSAYAACLVLTFSVRRRPLGMAAALAAAVLVCVETLLLEALSRFQAVTGPALLLGHLALVLTAAAGVGFGRARLPRLRLRGARPAPGRRGSEGADPSLWIMALGLLALAAGLAYRPNNGDSMTYHLARVAYWMENQSVHPYPTNIVRQVAFPPGAEYLLLILQAISHSERLANLVQFGAWVILACAAPPLARTFGAGRRLSRWAGFLFATAPMALVQASSTQNDLVAAVMAVAIVAACTPFLHARPHWRAADLVLLAAAVAAGLLVKPTSLVVAAPFLGWAVSCSVRQVTSGRSWRLAARALPGLIVIALLAARALSPVWRSEALTTDETGVVKPFVYTGFDDLADRALNPLRGILRNVPLPWAGLDRLAPGKTFGCEQPHSLCLGKNLLLINDDTACNPGQMLLLLGASLLALLRWRSLSRRGLIATLCLPAAWVLLHAVVRDNVFVTRLQLPAFALAPVGLAAFRGAWLHRPPWPTLGRVFLAAVAALGAVAVTQNGRRPLNPLVMLLDSAGDDYYRLAPPELKRTQTDALRAIEASGCRRLGMYIGENSYDYPIAWRALQHGIAVRHLVGPDDWPCVVYSDRGVPPPRPSGAGWEHRETRSVYFPAE